MPTYIFDMFSSHPLIICTITESSFLRHPSAQTTYFLAEVIILCDIRCGYYGDNYDAAIQKIMTACEKLQEWVIPIIFHLNFVKN